mgnify:CR=1 FL=1
MKKLFAIILSLLLIVTTLPLVYADTIEGTFGTSHTWTYDTETQTLTINGEGDMGGFWDMYNPPWSEYEGQMKTLVIGEGVTNVGAYLFYNSNLEKVVLGKDVKTIDEYAFRSSSYLANVELNDNLESIGDSAFVDCGSLVELTLNDNLKTIGKRAFVGTKLQSIEIPDSVTKISEGAFYNVPLKSVKIGNGVKTIEKDTFNYCADIQTLELGSSIETISEAAFYNCSTLERIVLPESLKTIEKEAFRECTKLADIIFPDSVETIGQGTFSDCQAFVNLKLGNGVESIGMSAFNGCISLETVEIPANVESIGDRAFSACDNLKEFIVAEENTEFTAVDGVLYTKDKTELLRYPNGKTDVVFEIPGGVKIIGDSAFSNSSLKRVVIPNTVTSIYGSVFAYNNNIDNVVIGFKCNMYSNPMSDVVYLDMTDGKTVNIKIKQGAFKPSVTVVDKSAITMQIPNTTRVAASVTTRANPQGDLRTALQTMQKSMDVGGSNNAVTTVDGCSFTPTREVGNYFAIDENTLAANIMPYCEDESNDILLTRIIAFGPLVRVCYLL